MKLPAVAIAAAFASGIATGLSAWVARHASSHSFVLLLFAGAATSLIAGCLLIISESSRSAAAAAVMCWALLGVTGACLAQQPRSPQHVLSLADSGKINLRSPLRFYGRLRDEPENLAWGTGYDVELSAVESQGAVIAASGGLRLSYAARADQAELLPLHAGDSISFLTQAKMPQVYRDEGAFDRREYLSQQGIDLVGVLRAPQLLEFLAVGHGGLSIRIAGARRRLRDEIDALWATQPNIAGVLRAMLLGDRNFVDRDEATDFQKTGAFHVLVVAGLHVGPIAALLFWLGRKLRWPRVWTTSFTLIFLLAYVAVVQQRTPVLRAALMAAIVLVGRLFFRRLDLLNSAAIAALVLLIARPLALRDSSFQLSFLAIGCISGLALPWLERTVQPYARALRGWRDVTRDASHEPRPTQFRIDLRSLAKLIESHLPARLATVPGELGVQGLALTFRAWELLVLTLVLQIGMLPLMAGEFHRITFSGPFVNFAAVPLTAIIVPLGFLTVLNGLLFPALGKILAVPMSWITLAMLHVVRWFSHIRQLSYRIPGPPLWITIAFLAVLILVAAYFRVNTLRRRWVAWSLGATLFAATMMVAIFPFSPQTTFRKLEVSILDVGQGDSLFVVSPAGKTLLIDGGGAFGGFPGHEQSRGTDPGEEAISPYLWSRGFKHIDVVALTHAHQDHLGGLNAILENFRVGRLWISREVSSSALVKLEELARQRHIAVEYESRGKVFPLDGAEGEFLWPENSPADPTTTAKNNDSLVLRLKYHDRTMLLPGDAEKQAEAVMLAENSPDSLHADVLKVGHHGSKNSTSQEFLDTVAPKIAIISAGEDNPYGHPSPELLQRLESAGVRILRTDRDGAVHIITDGEQLDISCFVPCTQPNAVAASASAAAKTPDQNQNQQQ
jgi:competence protein ComEC